MEKTSKEIWEAFILGIFGIIFNLFKWIVLLFFVVWLFDYYLADNIIQVCYN